MKKKSGQQTPTKQRASDPPPQFDSSDLGSPKKVWSLLCEKDEKLRRNPQVFSIQKKINARMRSMLLDWLMDVCADKHLHRETFHLCIDYIDRYISLSEQQLHPQRLQLIGSTALAIASKVEEIYPPKISDIAEYTDGCCSEEDIKGMEEEMLERLDWACYPVTAVHWLALYMQLMNTNEVLPARQVIVSAAKRPPMDVQSPKSPGSNSFADQSFHAEPPSLEVSIVSAAAFNDENDKPSDDQKPSDERESGGQGRTDADASSYCSTPASPTSSPLPSGSGMLHSSPASSRGRRQCRPSTTTTPAAGNGDVISFSCCYPRIQLTHIGSSPRVLLHTTQADITYVGHNSYSSGHIYPDQRCTVPKLMRGEFVRMASILDLVLLDAGSLCFRYSELATAVVHCCYEPEYLVCQITGFPSDQIRDVRSYVEPFIQAYDQLEPAGTVIPCLADVPYSDRHNIQTYIQNCLAHLETVQKLRTETEMRRKAVDLRFSGRVRKRKFGSTVSANHTDGDGVGTKRASSVSSYEI